MENMNWHIINNSINMLFILVLFQQQILIYPLNQNLVLNNYITKTSNIRNLNEIIKLQLFVILMSDIVIVGDV